MGPTRSRSSPTRWLYTSPPAHFPLGPAAPEGILWEPRPPKFGAVSPRRHIAWSSGQRRDVGSTTSVHRRELYAEARSLQLALLASLKTAWTLERRSPGSWRQQGGKKSQADKRILVGARAALPSETRFPRSRRSPPAKPSGYFRRRGAPGDKSSLRPNSRPGSQAPGSFKVQPA